MGTLDGFAQRVGVGILRGTDDVAGAGGRLGGAVVGVEGRTAGGAAVADVLQAIPAAPRSAVPVPGVAPTAVGNALAAPGTAIATSTLRAETMRLATLLREAEGLPYTDPMRAARVADAELALAGAAHRETLAGAQSLTASANSVTGIERNAAHYADLLAARGDSAAASAVMGESVTALSELARRGTALGTNTGYETARSALSAAARLRTRSADALERAGDAAGARTLLRAAGRDWLAAARTGGRGAWVDDWSAALTTSIRARDAQTIYDLSVIRSGAANTVVETTLRRAGDGIEGQTLARDVADMARRARQQPPLTTDEFDQLLKAFRNDVPVQIYGP